MRRHLLGIAGILLLALAAILFPFANEGNSQVWPSACLRVGVVLVLLWLAWPELASLSQWLAKAAMVVAIVAAVFSQYAKVLLPLLLVGWVVWKFTHKTTPRGSSKSSRRV